MRKINKLKKISCNHYWYGDKLNNFITKTEKYENKILSSNKI